MIVILLAAAISGCAGGTLTAGMPTPADAPQPRGVADQSAAPAGTPRAEPLEHPPQPTGSMKAPASTGARVVIVGQRGSGPTIGGAYARIAGQRDR